MRKVVLCTVIILVLSVVGGMLGCEPSARTQAVEHNNKGVALADEGRYDEAIAEYNKAIELDPKYALAYSNRGSTYYDKKQYDLAIADSSKAIELDPNYSNAYYIRGSAYYVKKQYDLAIADYTIAIKLDPGYAKAYNYRGNAYNKIGQYELAIADFNKVIELSTDTNLTQNAREKLASLGQPPGSTTTLTATLENHTITITNYTHLTQNEPARQFTYMTIAPVDSTSPEVGYTFVSNPGTTVSVKIYIPKTGFYKVRIYLYENGPSIWWDRLALAVDGKTEVNLRLWNYYSEAAQIPPSGFDTPPK
jgi:tetratricopeptide (TPR) repeat protein